MRVALLSVAGFLILMLLMGCASTTQPGVQIERVYIPQPVPCLPAESIPAEPPRVADSLTGDAAADLPVIAASALLLRAWGQEISAAMHACADK